MDDLKSSLRPAVVLLAMFSVLCGILYPLAVTGAANVLFPHEAHGSMFSRGGHVAGSELIGQSFTAPEHFWGRPSAVGYDAKTSSGTNLGPTNQEKLIDQGIAPRVQALHDAEAAAGVDNTRPVPVDLVTSSGSGLDPDITPAAAYYQVPRVAAARHLAEGDVKALVDRNITERTFGVLGERRVNVLALNLALDALESKEP